MPEGTTLERTQGVVTALSTYLSSVPEVRDYTAFVGLPSPMDFNGMVRHYHLRHGAHYADIRVTLAERQRRSQQSHAILPRIRRDLEAIAESLKARIKLVEVPPGPPVISTITVELYGGKATPYRALQQAAGVLENRLRREPLVVDVDTSVGDEIVPSADPGSRTFLVKVSLTADPGLYPGMFGRLLIPIGQIEKIYIYNGGDCFGH
jgi:multidrug efflux pump subunit AcrB